MGKKVVIVDDNESNLMLEQDLLAVAGFEVFTAENATGGIVLAREEKPDVIIMDMHLPDMPGAAAAALLRQDDRTRDVPIVFVTATVLAESRAGIERIANSGFIGKPINTRTFAQEISRFLK